MKSLPGDRRQMVTVEFTTLPFGIMFQKGKQVSYTGAMSVGRARVDFIRCGSIWTRFDDISCADCVETQSRKVQGTTPGSQATTVLQLGDVLTKVNNASVQQWKADDFAKVTPFSAPQL